MLRALRLINLPYEAIGSTGWLDRLAPPVGSTGWLDRMVGPSGLTSYLDSSVMQSWRALSNEVPMKAQVVRACSTQNLILSIEVSCHSNY